MTNRNGEDGQNGRQRDEGRLSPARRRIWQDTPPVYGARIADPIEGMLESFNSLPAEEVRDLFEAFERAEGDSSLDTVENAYDPRQRRDEVGRWTEIGAKPSPPPRDVPYRGEKLEGTGTPSDPFRCGSDLKLAVRLLAEGKHIRLSQPDQVSTLLDKLHKQVTKAVALGARAPAFDLCKVSVKGTNLFCEENLGYPRAQMPQLRGRPVPGSFAATKKVSKAGKVDLTREFVEHLRAEGTKVTETDVRASYLRASQSEIDGARVAQLVTEAAEGSRDLRERPIFVTRDNYIVDGHHHWAALVGLGSKREKDFKVPVYKLDMEIGEALSKANAYAKTMGIAPKSITSPLTNAEENCGTGAGGFKPGNTCAGGSARRMYRGVGKGSDTLSGFEWYAETPELARRYADFRGGEVVESDITALSTFQVGNPHRVLTARSFFADALKQASDLSKDKERVLEARRSFLSHFGDDPREVVDYWSSPEAKESTRRLLESMGFDSIEMEEGKSRTIAVLRRRPTTNNSEDAYDTRVTSDDYGGDNIPWRPVDNADDNCGTGAGGFKEGNTCEAEKGARGKYDDRRGEKEFDYGSERAAEMEDYNRRMAERYSRYAKEGKQAKDYARAAAMYDQAAALWKKAVAAHKRGDKEEAYTLGEQAGKIGDDAENFAERKHLTPTSNVDENCGTGAGGFQPGNTCAKGSEDDTTGSSATETEYEQEVDSLQEQRDAEDEATDKQRRAEEDALDEARDKEDEERESRREKEDQDLARLEKEYDKETDRLDQAREKADEQTAKRRAREDEALERRHEKERERLEADQEREDARLQEERDAEDARIEKSREKGDAQIQARREKEDAALDREDGKIDKEEQSLDKAREKEDERIKVEREREDKQLERRREKEDTALVKEREALDKTEANLTKIREKEDTTSAKQERELEAEEKAAPGKRAKEDQEIASKRATEDKRIEEQRRAIDGGDPSPEVIDLYEAEDGALYDKRQAEDDVREGEREKEDKDREARLAALRQEVEKRDNRRTEEDLALSRAYEMLDQREADADEGRLKADEVLEASREEEDTQLEVQRVEETRQLESRREEIERRRDALEAAREQEDQEIDASRAEEDKTIAIRREQEDKELAERRKWDATLDDRQLAEANALYDVRQAEDLAAQEQSEREDREREAAYDEKVKTILARQEREDREIAERREAEDRLRQQRWDEENRAVIARREAEDRALARRYGKWMEVSNVFCPTGEGGGIDPTCSPPSRGTASGLLVRIKASGGFTYQPVDATSPRTGFAVASFRGAERVFDLDRLTVEDVYDYITEHVDKFEDRRIHIGAWVDGGKVYLDLSTVVADKAEAVQLGIRHDQLAVFDLAKFETIPVPSKRATVEKGAIANVWQVGRSEILSSAPRGYFSRRPRPPGDQSISYTDRARADPYRDVSPPREVSEAEVANTFCPTGPGGGVDPSCSPKGKVGGIGPYSNLSDEDLLEEATKLEKYVREEESGEKAVGSGLRADIARGTIAGFRRELAAIHKERALRDLLKLYQAESDPSVKDWLKNRLESIHGHHVSNAFCPTGPGGGVDPTCSPKGQNFSPGDTAANRPTRPEERVKGAKPQARPFRPPPPKKGKKGVGKIVRPKGDESQTRIGDAGENLTAPLGFRNILPEGKRSFTAREVEEKKISSIDVEFDHSGKLYEVKICNDTATEYRLKAKKEEKEGKENYARQNQAEVYTMVGVRDTTTGEVHFYAGKKPGLIGLEVNERDYDYVGTVKGKPKAVPPPPESAPPTGNRRRRLDSSLRFDPLNPATLREMLDAVAKVREEEQVENYNPTQPRDRQGKWSKVAGEVGRHAWKNWLRFGEGLLGLLETPLKGRIRASGRPITREQLQELMFALPSTGAHGQRKEIAEVLDRIKIGEEDVRQAGMSQKERMNYIDVDKVRLFWSPDYPHLGEVLRQIAFSEELPSKLWESIKTITLSSQSNRGNAHWESTFGIKGFAAAATGGDRRIVFYKTDRGPGPNTLAHEAGHTFAYEHWGTTSPPESSAFRALQNVVEGKVVNSPTSYGKNSTAEDFAESVALFVQGDRRLDEPRRRELQSLLGKPPML
jgi:hypothetical protein